MAHCRGGEAVVGSYAAYYGLYGDAKQIQGETYRDGRVEQRQMWITIYQNHGQCHGFIIQL